MVHHQVIRQRVRWHSRRFFCVLAVSFSLVACAGDPVRLAGETRSVDAEQAMIMPRPGTFAITGVVQKRFSNGQQQEVFLSTNSGIAGENVVQVRFFGTRNPIRYGDDPLAFASLTESRVDSEMRGTLPHVAMRRSPYMTQNSYGPFGYAIGRPSSSELCMYAWQQLRAPEGQSAHGTGAIQIRVRLCDRDATEKTLLDFMYGLTIAATVDAPGWNPYGPPPPVNERFGKSGAPIYPPATETVVPAASVPPARILTRTVPQADTLQRSPAMTPTQPFPQVVVPSPGVAAARLPAVSAQPAPARAMPVIPTPAMQSSVQVGAPVPAPAMPAHNVTVPSPSCIQQGQGDAGRCP